jgi:hypothetical protein
MKGTLVIAYFCAFLFVMAAGALLFLASVFWDIARGEIYLWTNTSGKDLYAHWETEKPKFVFHAIGKTAIGLALLSCVPAVTRGLLKKIRNRDA